MKPPCPRAGTFASRAEQLEHARACASCRAALVGSDPSAVFGLLASRAVPRAVLDDVSAGVGRAIRSREVARGSVLGRRALAWAAALLVAVGCGTLWVATSRAPAGSGVAQLVPEPATRAAGVELLASPGTAQVVDVSVGDTQLVMIFDEGMQL